MSAGGSEGDIRVAVEAAGTDEAIENIDKTEESLNEAGESMGDTAGEMGDLTRRMKGLGAALAASLAVAAAGLLSQVPVIGEVMGGLVSIIEAIAFQMDQVLRPVLQPLTNAFYDISAAIFEADGVAGDIIGALGTLAVVLAGAAAAAYTLSGAAGVAVVGLGALLSPIGLIAAAIGGLVAAWILFEDEIRAGVDVIVGLFEGVWDTLTDIGEWLTGGVSDALGWLSSALSDPMDALEGVWDTLTDIGGWATSAVEGAFDWLGDAIDDPLGSVQALYDKLQEIVSETWNAVVEIGMELLEFREASSFEEAVGQDVFITTGSPSGGGTSGGGTQTSPSGGAQPPSSGAKFSADRGDSPPVVRMDGRRLTQQDSRYRRNGTAQRGRNG